MVPDGFKPALPSLGINGSDFHEHIRESLHDQPVALPLLDNNPLRNAVWSDNRKRIEVLFMFPADAQLHLATHASLAHFIGSSTENIHFIERPTISSLKWLAVPCLDADGNILLEDELK